MKVAHSAICTPRRCGLYETARELVAAERALGIDARLVDPKPHPTAGITGSDRGVPIASLEWGADADLVVSHSGHDGTPIADATNPIIVAVHGRPASTFAGERDGGAPSYSYLQARAQRDRYRGFITFWPEHVPYLLGLVHPKSVHYVPATVDLDHWCPGPTTYSFGGARGGVNVVLADPWTRSDTSMIGCVHAFERFRHAVPEARLHIFAHDGNARGLAAIRAMLGPNLGVVQGWAADLRRVYRAADLVLTPHVIATRTKREALATGCPVTVCDPHDLDATADDMMGRLGAKNAARMTAQRFSPALAGDIMAALIETHARAEVAA